jgi:hypothetical protein
MHHVEQLDDVFLPLGQYQSQCDLLGVVVQLVAVWWFQIDANHQ